MAEENKNEGTSDQAGGNTTGENTTGANESTKIPERVFTQDEVSRMMAREKHQGRNAVYNELGIDPDDTSAIKMFKAFVEAQKTEDDKQAEIMAKNRADMLDMANKLKTAEAKAALMQVGVLPDYVDDAVVIALSKLSADESLNVETVANDLKSKYSVWFNDGTESNNNESNNDSEKQNNGKKGTGRPATSNNTSSGNSKVTGIGKRLAEARKTQKVQSSFWAD